MGLKELISEELIVLEMNSQTKIDGIKELAEKMKISQRITDLDVYLDAVMVREEESTTGIGFGVGIPHGKSIAVQTPSLAFGRSQKGIAYDSMDGKPVHLLFLIAVPENSNDEHLRILSQLSRKLMHQEIRDRLMNAVDKEEIYTIIGE
ncbi:fructose-specific phosphotransferase system IIA component [Enterococcus sp. PF1-24]|uniref:PTS sugar transporter subunit IIA n=1 Tax=unclassified Enterococcus TaxID=2608891 RepID=UPI0024758F13|nr:MULTISPECIES: PTS sugar transporter subunit IIA [unclassified Enterococcus]MDH6364010.1 fructose-specific phosphotransferase system IIA component [Enterococcus sp. PFB1-1]MDH6401111.1 fructose-specific phosphotransferase system IIA component [Enterococcus sp. PF1-24]